MCKKIIAHCCICSGPVYSDGTTDCNSRLHEIDVDQERDRFFSTTGMFPEKYLEHYNQDNVTHDTVGNYYLALLLVSGEGRKK